MKNILVTGANGQLGQCLKKAASVHSDFNFVFVGSEELDISKRAAVLAFFRKHSFDYCINAAAYTNVEKAESERDLCFAINADGAKYLSEACKESDTTLIHISTDYVFDGKQQTPYRETDQTNPINVYGASKLKGEQYIEEVLTKYFIFRTSWLYSQYGNNFMKSVLNWAKEGRSLSITTEQTGTPTNANDLAEVLLQVIVSGNENFGLYHFSNGGEGTWFDFAKKILEYTNQLGVTNIAKTDHYTTFAARPDYSVMEKGKVCEKLDVQLIDWKESLKKLLNQQHNKS